jgi:hypothetical protein
MRTFIAIALSVATLLVSGHASADTRPSCIAACEATAQACLRTAHETYEACIPAARTTCAREAAATQVSCLGTAARSCRAAHSDQTDPCRASFTSCYATCGAGPANQAEFWCELQADATGGSRHAYKEAFCAGRPGQDPLDQEKQCMKRLEPANPAIGYSLGCNRLR